jgi:hypothetical protein
MQFHKTATNAVFVTIKNRLHHNAGGVKPNNAHESTGQTRKSPDITDGDKLIYEKRQQTSAHFLHVRCRPAHLSSRYFSCFTNNVKSLQWKQKQFLATQQNLSTCKMVLLSKYLTMPVKDLHNQFTQCPPPRLSLWHKQKHRYQTQNPHIRVSRHPKAWQGNYIYHHVRFVLLVLPWLRLSVLFLSCTANARA